MSEICHTYKIMFKIHKCSAPPMLYSQCYSKITRWEECNSHLCTMDTQKRKEKHSKANVNTNIHALQKRLYRSFGGKNIFSSINYVHCFPSNLNVRTLVSKVFCNDIINEWTEPSQPSLYVGIVKGTF